VRRFVILLALVVGCADEDAPISPVIGRRPPPRPDAVVTSGGRRWFVVSRLWLGQSEPHTGIINAGAWRDIGFDLDGASPNEPACRRGDRRTVGDGFDGIDNAFGSAVIPNLDSLVNSGAFWWGSPVEPSEARFNTAIGSGKGTLVLRIDTTDAADNAKVAGAAFIAAESKSTPPASWFILKSSLVDGATIEQPKEAFPAGYVRRGRWVSGEFPASRATLTLPLGDMRLRLTNATIMFDLATGRGVIAGAARAVDLEKELITFFDGWSCDPALTETVRGLLAPPADLVLDAANMRDPSRVCDGTSVAIAFDATEFTPPSTALDDPSPTSRCD